MLKEDAQCNSILVPRLNVMVSCYIILNQLEYLDPHAL